MKKIEGTKKYLLTLNTKALFEAQLFAINRKDLTPAEAGNNSGFIRWLIDRYLQEIHEGENDRKPI